MADTRSMTCLIANWTPFGLTPEKDIKGRPPTVS